MSGKRNGKKRFEKRYDFEELRKECVGQWPHIVAQLSQMDISEALAKIGKHIVCPVDHGVVSACSKTSPKPAEVFAVAAVRFTTALRCFAT